MAVINALASLVNPTGAVGIVGVYFSSGDPGAVDKDAEKGVFRFPLGAFFDNGISIGMGQCPVKQYNAYLRDLIIVGRAKPSFIVSHRLSLNEAPAAYEKFDHRSDNCTKVLLKPQAA